MSKNIDSWDCTCTDEIVCPYCGYEFSDSSEYLKGMQTLFEVKCDECDKNFKVEAEYSVTYTSMQTPCKNGGEHNWSLWRNYGQDQKSRYCRWCDRHEYAPIKDGEAINP